MAAALVEHVVADAGAFLKRSPLQEIGKNIYSLKDVVDEIRDKQTKKSLAFLPYKLHFKEPFPEHIRFVTEFSKKTGDYPSLSATDIKVLALTYQLELENVGADHLKKDPQVKVQVSSTRQHPEAPVDIAGFHLPRKKLSETQVSGQCHTFQPPESSEFNSFQFWRTPLLNIEAELLELLGADTVVSKENLQCVNLSDEEQNTHTDPTDGSKKPCSNSQGESRGDEQADEDDDDDRGWITPSNIKLVQMDAGDWRPSADIRVACVTTDFAMQNVLIQIGLNVLSVNGMLIKNTRNYILRCFACFKTTTNMTKVFCPHCGNNTLKKIAVSISDDGSMQMHFSRNPKVMNPKGLRYSLPKPQGGKHADNPLLVEDQCLPQQRLSRKARQKTDVFDPDYVAGNSPFSENDIYSRAANLHIQDNQCGGGRRRCNPNAARKKFVKKK
ncbi:RNA-binding protein NOB1 [Denticeps clupeoides]|uniref:RNA-binding protein NOB1 n=1 Tax=Denticeps clupeoides TaxID=299321 RepID=A0AAY4DFF2_9TELE|nr:RNA-binding protein NOB1 [Denticeps clupeoides]